MQGLKLFLLLLILRFKEKYHPDEADKRYVDQCASIHWRADIFKKLVEYESFQAIDLDLDNESEIIKVLDSGK